MSFVRAARLSAKIAAPALAAGLVIALSFGFTWLSVDGNQHTYVLEGLQRLDPDFLRYDWLASETYHYHPAFAWIVVLAGWMGSVAWGLAILNVVAITLSFCFVYFMVRSLSARTALSASLVVGVLILFTRTASVGGSYIFSRELQPSGIAATALLGAIAAFVRGRWLPAGAALAVSGIFHSNYLVLDLAVFGLATLALWRWSDWKGRLIVLLPCVIIFAIRLPVLLAMSNTTDAALARDIFLNIRSPHHYLPRTFLFDFVPVIAWQLLAAAFGPMVPAGPARRRVVAIDGAMTLLLTGAAVLTTVVFIPSVSQLFVLRLAPFAVLIAQVIVCTAVMEMLCGVADGTSIHPGRAQLAAMTLGCGLLAGYWIHIRGYPPFSILLFGTLLAFGVPIVFGEALARRQMSRRAIGRLTRFGTPALFAVAGALCVPRAMRESNLLNPSEPPADAALYRWAASTPETSRFLTPPGLTGFRLRARRAIIADWKSTPILPDELTSWYRRLQEISGLIDVRSLDDASAGYEAMPVTRLERLASEFRIDYAVLPTGHAPWAQRWVVFRNDAYQVVDVDAFVAARRLARAGKGRRKPSS